jgi:DNA modification methylase
MNQVIQGDCLEVMRSMPDNSVDSFVSDPPAGIAFMGKGWDTDKGGRKQWCSYMEERFAEALRLCKPGAYGLVWALPRTSHWTATALEDAGWEVRDIISHLFGRGMPKGQNISKAIDKLKGEDREVLGLQIRPDGTTRKSAQDWQSDSRYGKYSATARITTAPASAEAKQWDGFNTALKPACENWILVRKPVKGTVVSNVLEWGVGGLNVGECRIGSEKRLNGTGGIPGGGRMRNCNQIDRGDGKTPDGRDLANILKYIEKNKGNLPAEVSGRYPANLVLSHSHDCNDDGCADDCPVKALDEQTGELKVGGNRKAGALVGDYGFSGGTITKSEAVRIRGNGGASKYFTNFHYYPKASKKDRTCNGKAENNHPTVKNRELMKWLCRLVTPPGGTVLDCFAGSGSTAIACLEEGFNYILIEQDPDSVETANNRIAENAPEPTIEQRLQWLETKVSAIDHRSKKTAELVGQLNLFEVA